MTRGIPTPYGVIGISPHAAKRAAEMDVTARQIRRLLTEPYDTRPNRKGDSHIWYFDRGDLTAVIAYCDEFPGLDANVMTFLWSNDEAWAKWEAANPDTDRKPKSAYRKVQTLTARNAADRKEPA